MSRSTCRVFFPAMRAVAVVALMVLETSLFAAPQSTSAKQPPPPPRVPVFAGELTGDAAPPAQPLSLWYRRPADKWVEALPIGNGRLAAMVFGGIVEEHLQLNEDMLWAGGPYDPNNPEALAAPPEAI